MIIVMYDQNNFLKQNLNESTSSHTCKHIAKISYRLRTIYCRELWKPNNFKHI